jgi:hypothetical protein
MKILSWENGNNGCVDEDVITQSGYRYSHNDFCSSRMVVSDADDDDASVVRAKHNRLTGNDVVKVGSSSSHASTTGSSNFLDEPHQDTPLLQDFQEIIARTTTKGNENNINKFCHPLFYLTSDRKTEVTIQARDHCARDSHSKLVDEYAFKYDRHESIRKDFNASRTSKPEDSPEASEGIHRNPIDANLPTNPHKIAEWFCATSDELIGNEISNNIKKPNLIYQHHQSQHYQRNQSQQQISHKTSFDKDKSISTKMPSKVAPCLPRQRSRAIAIKRSRPGDFIDTSDTRGAFVENEARRCDVELYDYATWRMYNRIIDHRRKNLLRVQHKDDHSPEQQHNHDAMKDNQSSASNSASTSSTIDQHNTNGMNHPSSLIHGQRRFVHHSLPYTGDDYYTEDDDEIFDLEL